MFSFEFEMSVTRVVLILENDSTVKFVLLKNDPLIPCNDERKIKRTLV